ncbi:MAG: ATP-binding cassette domain-containing protein, partial [Yaniella sp.]|nr:ATP-binding cassette domain-containing protein [Yaniella sp.]
MSVKTSPQLHLEGISRTFSLADARHRAVLDDISLTVNPGEFVSIIGPSGCGKSTLFNIIAGLDSPTSGTVGIDGEVAYMPQKDALFPWRSIA